MIPIGTDIAIRRTPWANYALVAVNVLAYLILNVYGRAGLGWLQNLLALDGGQPKLYQFLSYQFLHANLGHIAGNMIFLWVFGNPVNARMGHWPYLLFYLAAGVFAAAGYALGTDAHMVGASGAIAGVTTAYLALFPRSHITFLIIFYFITTWELPSMLIIVLKIVVWDNILAPKWFGASNVAHSAHLAGYAFGFAAAVTLLWIRALPRSQFDILALWRRWWQRQAFSDALAKDPAAEARAKYGRVANVEAIKSPTPAEPDPKLQRIAELRQQIGQAVSARDMATVSRAYGELLELDPGQVLSCEAQLELGNYLLAQNRYHEAVQAYEKLLAHFPRAPNVEQIQLLLGVVYVRYLEQYDAAEKHLRACQPQLRSERQRTQCQEWLEVIAQRKDGTQGT